MKGGQPLVLAPRPTLRARSRGGQAVRTCRSVQISADWVSDTLAQ